MEGTKETEKRQGEKKKKTKENKNPKNLDFRWLA